MIQASLFAILDLLRTSMMVITDVQQLSMAIPLNDHYTMEILPLISKGSIAVLGSELTLLAY
jgi:hypothetical protein